MPEGGVTRSPFAPSGELDRLVTAAIGVFFAAIVVLRFTHNINWDEFFFLSHVYAVQDDRLTSPFQTAYVHAFGWLTVLPGAEVGQIIIARVVMAGFLAATCWAIWRLSRCLCDPASARIAVLAFLVSGFTIKHGASFRADPMTSAFLMISAAVMTTTAMRWWQVAVVALCSAFAVLVTIKAALYLPVYLGALWWRWGDRGVVLRILLAGALALVLAGGLFAWHAAALAAPDPATGMGVAAGSAAKTTLLGGRFIPRAPEVKLWALLTLAPLILAFVGLRRASSGKLLVLLVLFAMPVASVAIYRNAWPYFFPYIVPPMMILVAVGAQRLAGRKVLAALVGLALTSGVVQVLLTARETMSVQRDTIAEVHRLFPRPTEYLDRNAMIASYPRHGFFMSTWGVSGYRRAGLPVVSENLRRYRPAFVLANGFALQRALTSPEPEDHPFALLPEDWRAIHDGYVHHAGVIWIAGGGAVLAGPDPVVVKLPFPGRYRVETPEPVTLNGVEVAPGAELDLPAGEHSLSGRSGDSVALVWATEAPREGAAIRPGPLYYGFWRLP